MVSTTSELPARSRCSGFATSVSRSNVYLCVSLLIRKTSDPSHLSWVAGADLEAYEGGGDSPMSIRPSLQTSGKTLFAAAFLACSVSCLDTASTMNDYTQSIAGTGAAAGSGGGGATSGTGAAGATAVTGGTSGAAGRAAAGRGGSPGTETGTAGTDAVTDEDGGVVDQPVAGEGAAGVGGETAGAAGEPAPGEGQAGATSEPPPVTAPDPTLLIGTGGSCQSYTPPANGMCAGWFCGVNEETLAKAIDPMSECGGDAAMLCSGAVPEAVGQCARELKTSMAGATDEELRPLIEQCVYQANPEIQEKTPQKCLACTIDVAQCAGQIDTCLFSCLSGNSPECDTCRLQNNCDQMVFPCLGLPSPIP